MNLPTCQQKVTYWKEGANTAVGGLGHARLDTMIELPDPCFGIIVSVTSFGESRFAATGLSRADGEED